MEATGRLFCEGCMEEIKMGDGIKFIKLDSETLMYHKVKCYDEAKKAIKHEPETIHIDD